MSLLEELQELSGHELHDGEYVRSLLAAVLSDEAVDEREEALGVLVEKLAREWLLQEAVSVVARMTAGVERAWVGAKLAGRMIEIGAHDLARDLLRDATRSVLAGTWLESISVLIAIGSAYSAMADNDEAESALALADERLRQGLQSPSNHQEEADAQRLCARVGQAWAIIGKPSRGRDLLNRVAHPAIRERALSQIDGIERARGLAALELTK